MAGLAGPFRPGRWDVSMNAATSQHATGWEPGRGQGCWWWLRACQAPRCFESFLCDLDHGCRWLLQSQSLATVYESPVYDLKPQGMFSLLCLLDFHIIAQSFRMPSLFPHEFYTKKKNKSCNRFDSLWHCSLTKELTLQHHSQTLYTRKKCVVAAQPKGRADCSGFSVHRTDCWPGVVRGNLTSTALM